MPLNPGSVTNSVFPKQLCGAKRRQADALCTRPAGWGTKHPGEGRCKLHGGASTGPRNFAGNKNAVTTGEHEALWFDVLDPEEQELIAQVNTAKMAQIDNAIALAEIRERRMLKRLAKLQAGGEMVTSEEREGHSDKDGQFTETTREHRDKRVQALEDALTRHQTYKAKLVQLKHEIEKAAKDAPNAQAGIDALVDALARSRQAMEDQV